MRFKDWVMFVACMVLGLMGSGLAVLGCALFAFVFLPIDYVKAKRVVRDEV